MEGVKKIQRKRSGIPPTTKVVGILPCEHYEHEVKFNGVRFVNALWIERKINEMFAESD